MEDNKSIINIPIENEMKTAYMTYAMSVIISRALPDVRDGLKPVHRRILHAMNEMNMTPGSSYKKSARIVGEVLGKYHPHGDMAIYNTLVRLAQDFSMRNQIIDGQGNYGSVDGDTPAAMRYTEAKMTPYAMELLKDIDKNTVDRQSNFDDSLEEPTVLPAGVPNLLVNGSTGIAVGMATNIPPHNLEEVISGVIALIENPNLEIEDLMEYIKGPDFPTYGIIQGRKGIRDAYLTGRGKITVRAKIEVEEWKNGRQALIITELPYQVNKAELLIKISTLVREKRIEGISEIRDESDRKGMRAVIELKKGTNSDIIIKQLYTHTSLQNVFGIIMLALVNKKPKILNLKESLSYYIEHRKDIVIRRTKFELDKAEKRFHIVEGLIIALSNINDVIKLIRSSENVQVAKNGLMETFNLSERQAVSILDMRLQRLTALETNKLKDEIDLLKKMIDSFKTLLEDDNIKYQTIKDELIDIKEKFKSDRRTEIAESYDEIDLEDLIERTDNVVTISSDGYAKRLATNVYKKQKRGGVGVKGANNKENDYIKHMFVASTHDYLMLFSDQGRAFYIKVYQIPEASKTAKGKPIKLLLKLNDNENIQVIIPVKDYDDQSIVLITKKAIIKRTNLSNFINAKTRGIRAITLDKDDQLISAELTDGKSEIILCTRYGKALKIKEENVRNMGRNARGVKGIRLKDDNEVIGVSRSTGDSKLFIITENGYGKLIKFEYLQAHHRGTGGQIYIKINDKIGNVVSVVSVKNDDEVIIITSKGMTIKVDVKGISTFGRHASGVKIVNVKSNDFVVGVSRACKQEDDDIDI